MEFVHESEIADLLRKHNLERVSVGSESDEVYLQMRPVEGLVHLHLSCKESAAEPHNGASVVPVEKTRLPQTVEHIIHLLGIDQILLLPVGKWRQVFDAVAFSLASNEDWQVIDAAATVELNTRDPILCEPGDFHTLVALIEALLNDAERPDQGLIMVPTAAPVLLELVPDGAIRLCLGNQVLADEVADALTTG